MMTCPICGSAQWTRLRRWYMGRTTCWWCDYCCQIIPTVTLVQDKP